MADSGAGAGPAAGLPAGPLPGSGSGLRPGQGTLTGMLLRVAGPVVSARTWLAVIHLMAGLVTGVVAVGLVVSLVWMFGRRRRTVTTTRTPNTTEVYEERRYTEPPV